MSSGIHKANITYIQRSNVKYTPQIKQLQPKNETNKQTQITYKTHKIQTSKSIKFTDIIIDLNF